VIGDYESTNHGGHSATGTFWSGPIDDVRIYDVALSTEETAVLAL